jgi:hypothetical protein
MQEYHFLRLTPFSLGEVYRNLVENTPSIRSSCCFILADWLLGLLLDAEDGGSMFLRTVGKYLPDYTSSHPRR